MSQGVRRTSDPVNAHRIEQQLKIPLSVPSSQPGSCTGAEKQGLLNYALPSIPCLYLQANIVKVHILPGQTQGLRNPRPGIQDHAGDEMGSRLIPALRLELKQASDLLGCQCGDHLLVFLQLGDLNEFLPMLGVKPSEVRFDASEVRVNGDRRHSPMPKLGDFGDDGLLEIQSPVKRPER